MPNLRRVFTGGRINKDIDPRLLEDGEYRDALNIDVVNSETSNVGSVEKSYSNVRVTNLPLGTNPKTIGGYSDEFRDKLYWLVKSDTGCFLIEYDRESNSAVFVLQDTRPLVSRVLNLNENFLATGIEKIISEDIKGDLMVITDDNMEPICINIERAKTYGENGFFREDIYLIKKPPRFAPSTTLVYTEELNNNIEEKFLLFAYRYRYLDGEYSALSSFTNYKFSPKPYNLDYYTNENLGMVNSFSGIRVAFDTGDKRVTDVQIVVKESNSNVLYIVENFNKVNEGWGNLETRNITYSNNKVYTALPASEILRSFDNVPRKAKSLSIIGNRLIFGNYLEGYNLVDINQNNIKIDFDVSLITRNLDQSTDLLTTVSQLSDGCDLVITNTLPLPLLKDKRLIIYISIKQTVTQTSVYSNSFFYILPEDFASLQDVFNSSDFVNFINVVNNDFQNNMNFIATPSGWTLTDPPEISSSTPSTNVGIINVSEAVFTDEDDVEHNINLTFVENSYVSLSDISTNASLKTNRDYEAAIIYLDDFGRKTIALTSLNNTIYIPQDYSTFQNRLKITINNRPPVWADRYKIAVKTQALTYETLIINKYYLEDLFIWCKLEGDGIDKVKQNDILIVKRTSLVERPDVIKVKVLEIKEQPKNFISGNVDPEENEIIEEAGNYMRIKPTGFSMDFNDFQIYQDSRGDTGSDNFPKTYMSLFTQTDPDTGDVSGELAIPQGSSISLYINSSRRFDSGWANNTLNKEYFAQRNYDTLEEWFQENILNRPLFGNEGNAPDNYQNNLEIVRGFIQIIIGVQVFTPDPAGLLYLKITGTKSGGTNNRKGYVRFNIVVRTTEGFFVFETETKKLTDVGLFYESEETFEIIDNNHTGNITNQDADAFIPAEVELSFYNCYSQGNGVESYKIKDSFNKPFLNIDMRPTTTSLDRYRAIRRYADLTYSEPFIESANINGLNEFNLSLANFKELEKTYGSIQRTITRENDIAVFQEEKAGIVLFGKDAIYQTDGTYALSAIPEILGNYIPYAGQNGISKNPESLAINDKRIYYTNSNRGTVIRLSIDGVTEIIYGMVSYFRNLFMDRKNAVKLGGFDPYKRQYVLTVNDEPVQLLQLTCNNMLNKLNQTEPFSYNLLLNNLGGNIIIGYNITSGFATITATFDGDVYPVSNVTGSGSLSFERTSLIENIVLVTITPVSSSISYQLMNLCPVGTSMKIVTIIVGDDADLNTTVLNRFRWGSSTLYNYDDEFLSIPVARFTEETGIEGTGKFPLNGSVVNMQSYTNGTYTGAFRLSECNRMGYLVTDTEYDQSDINAILAAATFFTVTESGEEGLAITSSGNFLFNRSDADEILYMIWDFTSRNPVLSDDSANCQLGGSVIIDVLDNDEAGMTAILTIFTQPLYGTVIVNEDNTITYTHDGSDNFDDSFVYQVSNGTCASTATVTIAIGVPCSEEITASGSIGIYEAVITLGTDTGYAGISYNAFTIPDRFQIYYNNVLVADSLYRGNGIAGEPPSFPGLLGPKTLDVYSYNGSTFELTGETRDIDIIQADISPNPDTGGTGIIYFNKTNPTPATMKVVVTGPVGGTSWNFNSICPQPDIPT